MHQARRVRSSNGFQLFDLPVHLNRCIDVWNAHADARALTAWRESMGGVACARAPRGAGALHGVSNTFGSPAAAPISVPTSPVRS